MNLDRLKELFWRRVAIKENKEECWEWQGAKNEFGYGNYGTRNPFFNSTQAHRIAYFLTHGDFDRTLDVCHKCDNRGCVNPDHLFLGSHSQNMRDMSKKGRHWTQVSPERQRGENNNCAKLNWSQVNEIRDKYRNGLASGIELAKEYKVGVSTMYQILNSQTWKER